MGSGNNNDNLTAAYIGNTAVIRVEGRGSFKVSPTLKQFIHQVLDNHSAKRIWIDMSDCTGMDSTFMGVVAGIACLVKSKPEMGFRLINISDKNKKLLVTLGVDRVVEYSMSPTSEEQRVMSGEASGTEQLDPDFANKLEAAKTTLEAHETLVDINPENFNKFKSVLEFLQDDVRNLSGG
jgi:anti-anti-sigma factor